MCTQLFFFCRISLPTHAHEQTKQNKNRINVITLMCLARNSNSIKFHFIAPLCLFSFHLIRPILTPHEQQKRELQCCFRYQNYGFDLEKKIICCCFDQFDAQHRQCSVQLHSKWLRNRSNHKSISIVLIFAWLLISSNHFCSVCGSFEFRIQKWNENLLFFFSFRNINNPYTGCFQFQCFYR